VLSRSPGLLTTVVKRRTGRSVQEWIVERRMGEARPLLVELIWAWGRSVKGLATTSPSYFVMSFKPAHGTTPLAWRRAGRP
jgi:AraC family transcriptional activator of pobA